MKGGLIFILIVYLFVFTSCHSHDHSHDHDDDHQVIPEELQHITCGSYIKLKHKSTGIRLHSHQVTYGSGSGQQSVTGFNGAADSNSLWFIKRKNKDGSFCRQGEKINNEDIILLQHLATGKYLHSHLHTSPLTNQQEVSAYDGNDTGDNFQVLFQGESWKTDSQIRLKHVDTGKYLQATTATFGNPIPGQHEIVCGTGGPTAIWTSAEGIYFPLISQEKK
eukprot:TRINITY_DN7384_c1_g1_i1.p1 TRINITY_DN7384_c1_g1~~TRINITY_DN7384_c1_g1_i1.p1  ORF type:complete len:221 (-),score=61.40 TRINITY_DN7384_c1_g1_i1:19-681(-)